MSGRTVVVDPTRPPQARAGFTTGYRRSLTTRRAALAALRATWATLDVAARSADIRPVVFRSRSGAAGSVAAHTCDRWRHTAARFPPTGYTAHASVASLLSRSRAAHPYGISEHQRPPDCGGVCCCRGILYPNLLISLLRGHVRPVSARKTGHGQLPPAAQICWAEFVHLLSADGRGHPRFTCPADRLLPPVDSLSIRGS